MKGEKTVTQQIEEIAAQICDKYCKYCESVQDQDELIDKYCVNCPLMKLF
jgi:hypothetical protein